MVPTWVLSSLVIFLACIGATYLGSTLPDYEMYGVYLLAVTIACTLCVVANNFPMLMALGMWYPFAPPVPLYGTCPTFVLVLFWVAFILFFRSCLKGTIHYIPSFNPLILICFAWVPIRFLMNPIHHFGGSVAGGHGASGVNTYALYMLSGLTLVTVGGILNTREDIVSFFRWSFRICFVIGTVLLVCAFIPATLPFLGSLGIYTSGNLDDGISRFLTLPAYGGFMFTAALCPGLFHLTKPQAAFLIAIGLAMMVVGGARSGIAGSMVALPIILLLRRKTTTLILSSGLMIAFVGLVHIGADRVNTEDISPLWRSLGMLSSKIDDAAGGSISSKWRHDVWDSGIEKIKEHPLVGKGYGNLDKRMDLDANRQAEETDFDVVLAGGEAHNGFISSAYGFGVPFTIGLTLAILLRAASHTRSALYAPQHDPELRDLHAYLACQFITSMVAIYSAIDMCVTLLWFQIGVGIVLDRLQKRAVEAPGAPIILSRQEPMSPLLPSHSAP